MTKSRLAISIALLPIAVTSVFADGFILQRLDGDIAPNTDGKLFQDFSESVVNDSLLFGYRARLEQGSGVNLTNNDGAWLDNGCDARLLAREADDAPGTPVQFSDAIDQSSFQLNDAGAMAFRSSLRGTGVTTANDLAIYQSLPNAAATLVAREGDIEPITGGAYEFVGRPALTNAASGDIFYRAHLVRDGITVLPNSNTAIYGYIGGVHTLIAREGSPTPPLKLGGVGTFGEILSEAFVSDSGNMVFLANIGGAGPANIGVFMRDPGGTLSVLYQKTEFAPDATGAPSAEVLNTFRQIAVNDSGEVIVRANLLIGTAGVTSSTDEVVLTDAGGTWRRLAREGDADPTGGARTFFSFQTVFIGNSGATVFAAQALDGGVRRQGIYATPIGAGPIVALAREADTAPGTPSTYLRLDRPIANHNGLAAYTGRLDLAGGVTATTDSFLYVTSSAATPATEPLAREGDFEDDAQGPIIAFDLNEPNEPNSGVASSGRALNDNDDLIINLTTNGSAGVQEGVYLLGDRAPIFCDVSPDIAFNIPAGAGGTPVFWVAPTVTDDLDPSPVVISSHVPGDSFSPGVTIVTYTATDNGGNVSTTRFRVIVTEIRDPGSMVMLDRVVSQGDPATGSGATHRTFTEVTVNSNEDIGFSGSTNTGLLGVWSNGGGAAGGIPDVVALSGDPADTAEYKSFERLALNDAGDLLFQSVLQGAGVTASTNGTVDLEVAMTLSAPVREGNPAPDALGVDTARLFGQFYRPAISSLPGSDSVVRASLLLGTGGIVRTNDTGIWQRTTGGTALVERAVEDGSIPDGSGLTYGQILARVAASETGSYVFSAGLKGPGVSNSNNSGVFLGTGATVTRLVREGDNAPCGLEAASSPVKDSRSHVGRFATFASESINPEGTVVAIRAAMKREGNIDKTNDGGIWSIDVGSGIVSPLVIEGHQAPGFAEGVAFDRFDDIVVTSAGDIWFSAYLVHDAGLGITSANDFGIWTSSDGYLRWMVHEGGTAPNTDGGIVRRISNYAYEGLAASASIVLDIGSGDATGTNDTCLLSGFDALTGLLEINLREGDEFEFASGDLRTITNFKLREIFNANGGSGGYGAQSQVAEST